MKPYEWDPALDTGDETVDRQHRELVAMLNRLREAEQADKAADVVPDILAGLSAYVSTHFACEQDLMVSLGMPESFVAMHSEEHRRLTERTRDFVLAYRRGEVESVGALVDFVYDWLVHHIHRVDRQLVQYVREAGR